MEENQIMGMNPEQQAGGNNQPVEKLPIGVDSVRKWSEILQKYKSGKKSLEQRIIDAEQMWKLRHWEQIRTHNSDAPEPTSGWLVNVILAKHSDACDNYPQAVCLPREESDKDEARALTSILPVILQQNNFDSTWSDIWWYKLKSGTGVYGVYWDPEKNGGLGDVSIERVELLNLFWEPGIADIQDSRYVFQCRLVDNDILEEQYPQLRGKLKTGHHNLSKYLYDESIDTSSKSMLVDVYYKKKNGDRTILHFAKFVDEELLYATENDRESSMDVQTDPQTGLMSMKESKPPMSETGLYEHGLYPFVFDALFPEEGYPNCGFGYVDLCKDPQKYIDVMDSILLENMMANARPRYFIRSDGAVNEEEFADFSRNFVHVSGRIDGDSIAPITGAGLPEIYASQKQLKIDELKQISGNRDVNNGGTTASVTAASAIAALQEAGNGISRDMISAGFRAVNKVVQLCIELIREFYDVPRRFRILGANGEQQFVSYSNAGIKEQAQGNAFGVDMGYRKPVFDIEVTVQKESKYNTATYNELAVQLYQLGAFNPNMADQVLPMLDMMEFKNKQEVIRKISENAKLQKYLVLALELAKKYNPPLAIQMMLDLGMAPDMTVPAGGAERAPTTAGQVRADDVADGSSTGNAYLDKARAAAEGGSQPR